MARLPVLMYHSICRDDQQSTGLTISVKRLEAQLNFLKTAGYTTLHFADLKNYTNTSLPKKSVILTFDDVYVSQFEMAYPLLERYNFKASFFVPLKFIGKSNSWDENRKPLMSVEQLKALRTDIVELGLHSYGHINYANSTAQEIVDDFKACQRVIAENALPVQSVLAYPYGKYPRRKPDSSTFFEILRFHEISFGLRIGNRVNRFPFKNNYEVQRIDIKGEDSLSRFKLKLKFGKLKLF